MKKVLNIYLFLLAVLVGLEVSAGVFVAPVIFNPDEILGSGVLSHFQSGQLMTRIFLKFNNVLIFISSVAFLYEILNFITNKKESFNLKFSTLMLGLINFSLSLAFAFYFTPYIVDAQNLGVHATSSVAFLKMHSASEWTMKVMLVAQTTLFFLRFPKISTSCENKEKKQEEIK